LNKPIPAQWASGRRGPIPTSLLLFVFGSAVLLILGVLAAQGLVGGKKGFSIAWSSVSAIWGAGAVSLALMSRRLTSKPMQIAVTLWWLPFWFGVIAGSLDPSWVMP
jgi:hypothetical protein